MLVEIMEVSENDAFSCNRADLIGSVFEIHPMDVIEWKNGWFGIDKAKLVKGCNCTAERLWASVTAFHEVRFDAVP